MNTLKRYTSFQLMILVMLRFLIGWHLLYEGISKLLNSGWSSSGFLNESQWLLSGFAQWIVSNPVILKVVDLLNTWGLIAIGLGLILGLFVRTAAIAGGILLLVYYLNNPPLIGIEYTLPSEGNNLIVNKTLIESIALFVLAAFPTATVIGLESFFRQYRNFKLMKKGI